MATQNKNDVSQPLLQFDHEIKFYVPFVQNFTNNRLIFWKNPTSDYNIARELSPSKQHMCIGLHLGRCGQGDSVTALLYLTVESCLSTHALKLYYFPFISLCYS